MSAIARRFRVITWHRSYKSVPAAVQPADLEPGSEPLTEQIVVAPTYFVVELLNMTMDGVEEKKGTINIVIDTKDELTAENYAAIRQELSDRGLLADGGLLDASEDADALEVAKAERWAVVASIRDGLETKGFPYLDQWFDSDERSVARINTTAQAAMAAAMLNTPFVANWTTADNIVVPLTRDQVIGMPVAFAIHAGDLHEKARSLRERISSATSVPEVRLCFWEGVEDAPASI